MQAMPHQSKMKMSLSLLVQLSVFGGNVYALKPLNPKSSNPTRLQERGNAVQEQRCTTRCEDD